MKVSVTINQVSSSCSFQPGRVATLISEPHVSCMKLIHYVRRLDEMCDELTSFFLLVFQGATDGCAFRVSTANAKKTLKYLENRETTLGGYDSKITMFYPCDNALKPVKVVLYVALPDNVDWRGPAKLHDIADEVRLRSARSNCKLFPG